MKGLRFIPDDTNIDFIGLRYISFVITAVMIIGSIALVATKGLNFGIDFTGGTVIEFEVEQAPDLSELRGILSGLDLGAISLQEFGEPTNLMIRLPEQGGEPDSQQAAINAVRAALDEKFGAGQVDYRRTEYVGPQVGQELKIAGALAVLWAIIGIVAYVWFRFEWQYGVGAIIATLHDTTAVIGLFALTQMQFDLSTVAAVLLVAGYSINDTVVVYDRVRENMRKFKKTALPEILNKSVNQTLARTIMTSGSTLLALGALWLFGGEVIRAFTDALVFGILVGTYSSIFVAAPVLIYLKLRRPVEQTPSEEPVPEGS